MSIQIGRRLLIVDPTLKSFAGHSYHYDTAIAGAAAGVFDSVVIYADRQFKPYGGIVARIVPVLNFIPVQRLKTLANRVFNFKKRYFKYTPYTVSSGNATVLAEVPKTLIKCGEKLAAMDMAWSLRRILRQQQHDGQVHVFIQHTRISDMIAIQAVANRYGRGCIFHLVLRYIPEFLSGGYENAEHFTARIRQLSRLNIRFYTDSELLTHAYRTLLPELAPQQFSCLPIPVQINAQAQSVSERETITISMLGPPRMEKGFGELPLILSLLPVNPQGKPLTLAVQISDADQDPRVQAQIRWLRAYSGEVQLQLLIGPVPESTYFEWFRRSDILLAPYTSPKYAASTSGIFAEAVHLHIPVIVWHKTWMAQQIEHASRLGFSIGCVIGNMHELTAAVEEISVNLTAYRQAMRGYLEHWQRFNTPQQLIACLVAP